MAYDLEEQESLDQFKAWWARWGNLVSGLISLAALGVLANYGWQYWQMRQASEASGVYEQLQKGVATKNNAMVRDAAGVLIEKYSGTGYAQMAALVAAHANVDSGDLKTAQAQLQWATEHAQDDSYRQIARLRLASVLIDMKQFDAALKALDVTPLPGFAVAFADRRGDVYFAENKTAEARKSYEDAKAKLQDLPTAQRSSFEPVLDFKLDALASALPVATASPAAAGLAPAAATPVPGTVAPATPPAVPAAVPSNTPTPEKK